VRRLLALVLAMILLLLCGCTGSEEETKVEATPSPTVAPSPTPVARLSASQYSYNEYRNNTIRLKFLVPTHWVQRDGTNVVSFHEPVNSGEIDSMVSLAVKGFSKDVDDKKFRSECTAYMQYLSEDLKDFSYTEFASGDTLIDRAALSTTYTATKDGVEVKGYVALISNATRIYAFHFRSEASRYDSLNPVMRYIRDSFEGVTIV